MLGCFTENSEPLHETFNSSFCVGKKYNNELHKLISSLTNILSRWLLSNAQQTALHREKLSTTDIRNI